MEKETLEQWAVRMRAQTTCPRRLEALDFLDSTMLRALAGVEESVIRAELETFRRLWREATR